MAFGILECKKMEVVPGTVMMSDQDDVPPEYAHIPRHLLKHGTGRFRDIILIPQPSDSPNDPLNWPLWKKDMILFIVSLSAAVVGAYGPMLGPGFVPVAADLGISVAVLAQSTAWTILTIGLGLFVTNPLGKVLGRRPVYVFASAVMVASTVWGAASRDFPSFLGSRILGGIGMAPFEVLVQCTIADMYFVHQRATRLAAWQLFLLTGINGGALIGGQIIQYQGFRWTFGVCAIFFGVLMFAVFFLVPETAYRRAPLVVDPEHYDLAETGGEVKGAHEADAGGGEKAELAHLDDIHERRELAGPVEPKHSFRRSLRIFTGTYSDADLWKIFTRPVILFFYPAVFWGFLIYGTTLTWIVVFSVVNGVIFNQAPYFFDASQTGLISLSPLILTIIGEFTAGPLNDWLAMHLAKKNKGIYEPEFRLPLMLVAVVFGAVGFFGFGAAVQYQTHWSGPVICFGLANLSMSFAGICVFGYIVDSYRTLNEEAMVAVNARNLLTFGLTYFVNGWLAESGPLVVFCILGSLFVFVCALTIPLWIFGKRIRSFTGRNRFLTEFMDDEKKKN